MAEADETGDYKPYHNIIHGTEGAQPVSLRIRNDGTTEMACTAALAHWYSQDLGRAAPGDALDLTIWHDPATGVMNLLNAGSDRMPVEAIWCRETGAGAKARGRIHLPLATGPAPARLVHDCAPVDPGGPLACPRRTE